ncbi:double-stranded RNA binding motif domain-containing protein [Sutcliffiella rhizosphaerae]|uniref:DUF4190 domain-containing protein n=1 Tax=Sutcliffiella rhizosphaerae TaxID=2880967 RepID=A0ABN8ACW7_9BACI|nr:double-stranded RNA binding motif domain-containing protein [Sutcliffiella rhizosphaerae]CAG9622091.1 hypothetical protein BACCIP111883_02882 [Sutcliffiella rhizosphaerae]
MFILGLVLFGISFGLIGFGVFTALVRSEKKKGRLALVGGTILLIGTFIMFTYMPQASGEERITISEVAVTENENGSFACEITDHESKISYSSVAPSKQAAEEMCAQFEEGKEYTIFYEYDFDEDSYTFTELSKKEE